MHGGLPWCLLLAPIVSVVTVDHSNTNLIFPTISLCLLYLREGMSNFLLLLHLYLHEDLRRQEVD